MDFEGSDILKLAELLAPKHECNSDSDESDGERCTNNTEPLPSEVGKKPKQSVYAKLPPKNESKKYDALDPECEDALYFTDESKTDWRKTPKWDISYKQLVTASDVFLQMGQKSPATASCEDIILKIHLVEEDHRNIDLKITESAINLVSPKYRLEIPLPQPVDPKRGNAKWDQDTETLTVTLRMNREFDFINF
ncbi:hypothetical protein FQA39_LY08906 [Lamprigera yunnana]|nr:hypothetical protein FQA39_LY08906 [Lamprigera yunnana]